MTCPSSPLLKFSEILLTDEFSCDRLTVDQMPRRYSTKTPAAKFWKLVRPEKECWIWTGATTTSGYPVWSKSQYSGQILAARFAFEISRGHPPAHNLKRTCGNILCVRPDHLSDALKVKIRKTSPTWQERFQKRIGPPNENGCREFIGSKEGRYGTFGRDGRHVYAHRVAWELRNGPIPDGLHILHHCDNPPCVNTDHLYAGTQVDNVADRQSRQRHRVGSRISDEERARILASPELSVIELARQLGRTWLAVAKVRKNPTVQRPARTVSTICRNGHLKEGNLSPSGNCRLCNYAATLRYRKSKAP